MIFESLEDAINISNMLLKASFDKIYEHTHAWTFPKKPMNTKKWTN